MTAESAVRTIPAWFSKTVIDRALADGTPWFLFLIVLGYFAASAVARALASVQNYCTEWVGQRVVFDLRGHLYDHLQSQSMSFYDANQTGQLMSRVTNDVNQVQSFLTQGLSRLVNTFVTIGVFLTMMFFLDPHADPGLARWSAPLIVLLPDADVGGDGPLPQGRSADRPT